MVLDNEESSHKPPLDLVLKVERRKAYLLSPVESVDSSALIYTSRLGDSNKTLTVKTSQLTVK